MTKVVSTNCYMSQQDTSNDKASPSMNILRLFKTVIGVAETRWYSHSVTMSN